MNNGRIPSLDGIRAIAILSVILEHLSQRFHGKNWFPDGVGLFFVLSGYLITHLLLREKKMTGRIDLFRFYIRRFFRIVPPLYAYLAFIVLYGTLSGIHLNPEWIVAAILFFENVVSQPGNALVEHTWSLAVEEQFYILWPILMILTFHFWGRREVALLALATILMAPILRMEFFFLHLAFAHHREGLLLPTRMDSLGAGCFLALAEGTTQFEFWFKKLSHFWWIAVIGFALFTPYLSRVNAHLYSALGFSLDAILMPIFILWAARNPETFVGRFLNHPVIIKIGVLSYSIYLWQTLFIHADTGVRILNTFPLGLMLIPVAAWISYQFVELPAFKERNRILTFLEQR